MDIFRRETELDGMKGRELLPHEIFPEKKEEKTGIGDTTHASL